MLNRDTMVTGTILKGLPPRIGIPRMTRNGFWVRVRLHPGQTPAQFIAVADAFAHAWRVHQVRVTSPRRGVVELKAIGYDPLTGDRAWPTPPAPRLLTATLGRTDDDATWTVDLRKVPHWLVTGATQSGKSTLLASWLTELGSQPVILVGIDLKGGMELGLYERRLSALAVDRAGAIKVLTTVLSEVMERMADCRTAGVRSVWDLPEMTRPDPVVIIVDEVAELLLVASLNGRKEATECATLLLRIAQLGAALGVHLILAAQRFGSDLGPGATAIRAQMGGRVCHRVNDEQTAVMTLGDLAPDAVAVAQTITEDEKGVAVTAVEGQWRRVRSRWTTPSALRNHADLTNLPLTDAFLTPPQEGGVEHD
ncbi:FtsK/SpoIIIE domain-containing protein [Streptomyces parvus]|uniref:Cell division protein FtsK n=1 Tax=Streptomyces parvus TaxID=66428 RepID=A0A7K3RUI7_9ACTN|nr:FtsK/SpoIIIE domain-containing protein [Streptomyces parvus]NEC18432.1 cell division protein FtsK [Streptomyces parvus]